ncbi:30S ribosomal protein S17 [Babesia bigemina]|uniref:30S ribosomal protein S17 n=1 Tax=Babesia bigemina TaxID=5866 RepID=A0A061DEL0_BABBI|nr:30S ribosomal protein S17 [Babesia bigemina]CDR97465.1 30S ribosomal protein S17 [Babesia bigemina]|eukprot:XP_012769651.1 30S ribosomal protein S17 [Babesia bigemina]
MIFTSLTRYHWHYKTWQRLTAGYLRTFAKNRLPNNELIGYVINDKHPKSIRVACDRYMYVVRYKKTFRMTKKVWAHDEHKEAKLGDIVRVQPLGYRIGPWKTYVLSRVLHVQDPYLRDEENKDSFS